jgi:hypothetical protein
MAKRTSRSTTPQTSRISDTPDAYAAPVNAATDQADDRGTPADFDNQAISMGSEPSEQEIRMRAYRRYLERGCGDGRDVEDWMEAERELKQPR